MGCPDANTLAEFLYGGKSGQICKDVDEHLDQCSTCRDTLSLLAQADDDMDARDIVIGDRYELGEILGSGATAMCS